MGSTQSTQEQEKKNREEQVKIMQENISKLQMMKETENHGMKHVKPADTFMNI